MPGENAQICTEVVGDLLVAAGEENIVAVDRVATVVEQCGEFFGRTGVLVLEVIDVVGEQFAVAVIEACPDRAGECGPDRGVGVGTVLVVAQGIGDPLAPRLECLALCRRGLAAVRQVVGDVIAVGDDRLRSDLFGYLVHGIAVNAMNP